MSQRFEENGIINAGKEKWMEWLQLRVPKGVKVDEREVKRKKKVVSYVRSLLKTGLSTPGRENR